MRSERYRVAVGSLSVLRNFGRRQLKPVQQDAALSRSNASSIAFVSGGRSRFQAYAASPQVGGASRHRSFLERSIPRSHARSSTRHLGSFCRAVPLLARTSLAG